MEYRLPGTRYAALRKYNQPKHAPYDYQRDGLLDKVLPPVITNTKNKTTRIVLDLVENASVFLLKYVDTLKHFKNWNYKPETVFKQMYDVEPQQLTFDDFLKKVDTCDVILYNKKDGKLYQTKEFEKLDSSLYIPVGVVVVPTQHDVYGNGDCGVMALRDADPNHPDTGSIPDYYDGNSDISWGPYVRDYYSYPFPKYGVLRCWNETGRIYHIDDPYNGWPSANLPSDTPMPPDYTGGQQPAPDPYATYWYPWAWMCDGPYGNDLGRNPRLIPPFTFSTDYRSPLLDFAGYENTQRMIVRGTNIQPNWQTAPTIDTNPENWPAAKCCWRFHTAGTHTGSWYYPTFGELSYLAARVNKISQTIERLKAWSGNDGISMVLRGNDGWLSFYGCSTYAKNSINFLHWVVDFGYNGSVEKSQAGVDGRIRPFMHGKFPKI